MGQPLYSQDVENSTFHFTYDALRRTEIKEVTPSGGSAKKAEVMQYGEGVTDDKLHNLRGQLHAVYDGTGVKEIGDYNFKGHPTQTKEQLLTDYTIADVDWYATPALNVEAFTTAVTYDAFDRPVTSTDPGNNITRHEYDKSGALFAVYLTPNGGSEAAHVTATYHNAKGQREKIYYGNGTNTAYTYDPLTYRLTRLLTRKNTDVFQDLNYWYDPVGNITMVRDDAQRALYFNNAITLPEQDYTYDALYRLIRATGREQIGTATFGSNDNYNDAPWMGISHKGDDNSTQNYIQKYAYDSVGNILSLQHIADTGSYTRDYKYDDVSNRLVQTSVGSNSYNYDYDARGNMISMPHLASMDWNTHNQLSSVGLGGGGNAYYQYSSGERTRKVIENGAIVEERIYFGSFEIYRKFISSSLTVERTTVHVSDNAGRIAMLEVLTAGSDGSAAFLIRYIYSNHLSTCSLELDEKAQVISYEEYHPYGTTSYQAMDASIKAVAKRYRYTGKERDEESGLYYMSARYYAPWLARWIAVDPLEKKFSPASTYCYSHNDPIELNDKNGMAPPPSYKPDPSGGDGGGNPSPGGDGGSKKPDKKPGSLPGGSDGGGEPGDPNSQHGPIKPGNHNVPDSHAPQKIASDGGGDGNKNNSSTGIPTGNTPSVDNTGTPAASQQAALQQALQNAPPSGQVLKADVYGDGHIGSEQVVNRQVNNINTARSVQTGENIANGPFGALGYLINKDKGSDAGAAVDGAIMAAGALHDAEPIKAVESKDANPTGQTTKSVEEQAKELSKLAGKNRVTIPTIGGVRHYDLKAKYPGGGTHRGVPVPHIQRSVYNTDPEGNKRLNKDNKWVEPMNKQDLNIVAQFIRNLKK